MLISTEIQSAANVVGEEKAIELIAKAGFDAWDFSMFNMGLYDWQAKKCMDIPHPLRSNDYLAYARKLRKIGEDNGIHCNQSHAPFPVLCTEIRGLLKRAIECTAEAGGSICVIHPDNFKTAEENAEMYFELLPFAKSCGVKIATENMWNWDYENKIAASAACSHHTDFLKHLQAVNDDYFVACLDLGHAEMKGLNTTSVDMIRTLGDRLQALHIHDNDLHNDSHQLPFSMSIAFEPIAIALSEIGYKGYLTLECDAYIGRIDKEELPAKLLEMALSARKFEQLM